MEIHVGYCFDEEKRKHNNESYNILKDKAEVQFIEGCTKFDHYRIINNPNNLTNDELALICTNPGDAYKLNFGYCVAENGVFSIYYD